jgi:hypothetical protein
MSKLLDWSGKTCIILTSGPGLTEEQVEHARLATLNEGVNAIAINSTFKLAPWAEVIYAGDLAWWKKYHKEAARTGADLWTCDHQAEHHYKINRVKGVNRPGLGLNVLHTGGNSGYQALNLAFLFGCRRILLLGFTMRVIDGRKHWHPDHPAPLTQVVLPDEWRHKFTKMADDLKAHGCTVLNCDPLSALTCFPMSTIEEELER